MCFIASFSGDGTQNNGEFFMEIDILFPKGQKELLLLFYVCLISSFPSSLLELWPIFKDISPEWHPASRVQG